MALREAFSYPYVGDATADLHEAIEILSKTELGRELLADAEQYGTKITTECIRAHGSFDDASNLIKINAGGSLDRKVATLAHELRHAQQFKNGVLLKSTLDTPLTYLQSQWTIEADANVAAAVVAYDLKQQGNPGAMEELKKERPEIYKPFEEKADNGGLKDFSAHRAAFYGWFDDKALRSCYEKNYLKNFEYSKNKMKFSERSTLMQREIPVQENINKVCKAHGETYLSSEAKDFFEAPEQRSVTHDTYWAIYRNLRDAKNISFMTEASEVMKENGNITIRESEDMYYDFIRNRRKQAGEKIAAFKKSRHEIPTAALIKKAKDKQK